MQLNDRDGHSVLVVVGFHRSLTSVVAQWLHKSGLCMGEYLMPPAPSNPEGHYEDMPLVALHDDLLQLQGTNWQYAGEVELSPTVGLDVIQRYTTLRDRIHGEYWGLKDPRQCLFLPNWNQVLGDRGRYLVVIRHWSASIQSLLKRSARDLALGLGSSASDGRFWQEAGHAARVWIAYSEALLVFLESCASSQRLVVTQQALMQGLSVPALVSKQFSIPLAIDTPSPIKPDLVHDNVAEAVRACLTSEQVEQMNTLWDRLLSFADHKAQSEAPHFTPDAYLPKDRWLAHSVLAAAPFEPAPETAPPKSAGSRPSNAQVPEHSFMALSARAQKEYRQLELKETAHHTMEAMALKPDEASGYVRLACILLVSGQVEAAEATLSSAIDRLGEVAILLHYRATVLDLLGRTDEAITLLGSASTPSDILDRHRIAYLLKNDYSEGRDDFAAWARRRTTSLAAWQTVSKALAGVESQPLREDLALRVSQIWNRYL